MYGETIGGWKAASPAQDKLSLGPIYASDIYYAFPCPVRPKAGSARIEPEIAFVLQRDLGPRANSYAETEIRAAIGEPHLALEVLGGRYVEPDAVSFPEKLADALNNQALFVGPAVPEALGKDLGALPITVDCSDGLHIVRKGVHPSGHPLAPLYWLANFLAARGQGLKAGQIVTTGSYCGVLDLPLWNQLRVSFGDLGVLEVEFVESSQSARAD